LEDEIAEFELKAPLPIQQDMLLDENDFTRRQDYTERRKVKQREENQNTHPRSKRKFPIGEYDATAEEEKSLHAVISHDSSAQL